MMTNEQSWTHTEAQAFADAVFDVVPKGLVQENVDVVFTGGKARAAQAYADLLFSLSNISETAIAAIGALINQD